MLIILDPKGNQLQYPILENITKANNFKVNYEKDGYKVFFDQKLIKVIPIES
jgi:hypothetical protein